MTITTTAATPAGTTTFTVTSTSVPSLAARARRQPWHAGRPGASPETAQTITFGALADQTVGDPPFTVSATATSGLPVSFARHWATARVAAAPSRLTGARHLHDHRLAGRQRQLSTRRPTCRRRFTITAASPTPSIRPLRHHRLDDARRHDRAGLGLQHHQCARDPTRRPDARRQQGDTVTITLHNGLGENTALLFQGQAHGSGHAGAAPGGDQGLHLHRQPARHVPLRSRAAAQRRSTRWRWACTARSSCGRRSRPPTQAYADCLHAFDDEAVLVLSEIDPALTTPDPATFDMRNYKPTYFLINGKAYPDTPTPIADAVEPATRCCCATSTPAPSTTRWRCSARARR